MHKRTSFSFVNEHRLNKGQKLMVCYSPDKINVNIDFIKSNYLTACSNKNVKITIVIIYDGEQTDGYLPPQLQVEFIIVTKLLNNLT
jgi:hypothetical protein